jgi:hypothetical protein
MTTRWARVARGTLTACFAVFVSALFHAVAGGGAPSVLAVILCLAFCVPACIVLAGKRLSVWRMAVSVSLSQFVFHALFSLTPFGTHFATVGGTAHVHDGSQLIATAGGASAQVATMQSDAWMWVAHASAALLTIVALRYGEGSFWALLRTASVRIVAFADAIVLVPAPTITADARPIDVRPLELPELFVTIGRMRHRGPPARLFACA